MSINTWRYALAKATGPSHYAGNQPCQDALCAELFEHNGAAALLLAVADGAGSARFSQLGARLCCEVFCNEMRGWLETTVDDEDCDFSQAEAKVVGGRIRDTLCETASMFSGTSAAGELRPRDFACTWLGAVIREKSALFFQVGDGAIVVSDAREPDRYSPVFWPRQHEYANISDFVTDPELQLQFTQSTEPIEEIALFSDGLQRLVLNIRNRAAHTPFFTDMFRQLRRMAKDPGLSKTLSAELEKYLQSKTLSKRSDDDKSLILATRRSIATQQPAAETVISNQEGATASAIDDVNNDECR